MFEEKMETVLIVGVELDKDKIDIEASLDELEELVKAARGQVVGRMIQKKDKINAALFIGKGKAEEIREFADINEVDTIIFNDELSGAQLRNLEEVVGRKILDRTTLILDIFALRATTREGKLQVKLAQLKYRLPRLVGMRDYLSREGAGIGTRGPGEQKLETDRRHILREIHNIERQLREVEENREVKRKQRISSNLPIVALVGYTNAGKSTLLNKLIEGKGDEEKKVFVKDMLFATLDTALRKAEFPNGQEYLLTDTVGFVSKLPTHLVKAFKGTLEETVYADLLVHVVDASNKDLDIQINTTLEILKDLDVLNKPMITVFNKIDKVSVEDVFYNYKNIEEKIFISAKSGQNIDGLLEKIMDKLDLNYRMVELLIPYDKQSIINNIMSNYKVETMEYLEKGTRIKVALNNIDFNIYKDFLRE